MNNTPTETPDITPSPVDTPETTTAPQAPYPQPSN